MRYKNKNDSSIVEATQWFKNGDHPKDDVKITIASKGKLFYSEGKIVGYHRVKDSLGLNKCQKCNHIMNHHGELDSGEHYWIVCPTDWIITDSDHEYFLLSDIKFKENYEQC